MAIPRPGLGDSEVSSRQLVAVALASIALHAAAQEADALPDPAHALGGARLAEALRMGGFVLYFRHTATDFSQSDMAMTTYEECKSQRNLTEEGRRQAREIGANFREMKIPVGEVLASPYCRTMEVARLAFGKATATPAVRGAAPGGEPDAYAGLKALLATPVTGATNRVISGHGNPFRAIAGAPHLSEGEMVVIKPLGDNYAIVARVPYPDWPALK
jgi:hypothetical protein